MIGKIVSFILGLVASIYFCVLTSYLISFIFSFVSTDNFGRAWFLIISPIGILVSGTVFYKIIKRYLPLSQSFFMAVQLGVVISFFVSIILNFGILSLAG